MGNNILEDNLKTSEAKYFYYAFISGAKKLIANQKIINKINVFPVADADTGTNLASTFLNILESPIPTNSIKQASVAIADAALVGARGNSGIIIAQFLYGFSNEIKDHEEFTINTFSLALNNAVKYAYEAIANPVEGTMITVIKEWAKAIDKLKDSIQDIIEILKEALEVALQALRDTTNKLDILKKNKVVDAGAKGFVCFLEGIIDFLNGDTTLKALNVTKDEIIFEALPEFDHEEITYRYCCEALISLERRENKDKSIIENAIKDFGDSMVIAGSKTKLRLHIHADDPMLLFKKINQHADILYQKVDDMVFQRNLVSNKKNDIAILTDSTCDLPKDILEKNNISVVPLNININNSQYLDNLTLSSEDFYKELEIAKVYPSTSQPSYKDFVNKYYYLASHYKHIISVHIGSKFSGTYSNSSKAAQFVSEQTGVPIYVHDSKNLTASVGLITLRVAQAVEEGESFEKIIELLKKWTPNAKIFVAARTIKYLIKSGRVSYSKGIIGKLLNINPILTVDEDGKPASLAKSFSFKQSERIIFKEVEKYLKDKTLWGYSITNIKNSEYAKRFADKMKQRYGLEPIFDGNCSPVLGTNAGPGVVVISVLRK